jgi:hypothetical protein
MKHDPEWHASDRVMIHAPYRTAELLSPTAAMRDRGPEREIQGMIRALRRRAKSSKKLSSVA